MSAPSAELLGEGTVPSGILVLVDAGLLGLWDRSAEGFPATADFRVDGADADEAGRRFGRTWHPRYRYDVPADRAGDAVAEFAAFAADEHLDAALVELPGGVDHRRRIDLALEQGGGRFGILEFFGVRAPVIAGVPTDAHFTVAGVRMREPELADRWRWVGIQLGEGEHARSETVGEVFVDEARLMLADADALLEWCHEDSLDGLADFVFWGLDAGRAAAAHGAQALEGGELGWLDLPVVEAAQRGLAVEESREREGWAFATDFRPHSHHYEALRQMRASPNGAGTVVVGGAKMCAFLTSWGDGAFPVSVELDGDDRLVRLLIDLGNDETVARLRQPPPS